MPSDCTIAQYLTEFLGKTLTWALRKNRKEKVKISVVSSLINMLFRKFSGCAV
jgi:hypothetical protein